MSGSVFNGFWLNDTEALFELRVQTKSAEWTHQANILVGMVSIDVRSLTGYIEWNGGTKVNINLQIRQDADISGEAMDAQLNAINNNSYIEQYKAILLQHPESTPFSWGSNTIYIDTEYTLYDVDKNGTPELIVKEDMSKYYIYSFNGTDVISSDVCYWSYDECLYEYEGNGIVIHDGGMGSMRIENASLYSMVNNKLVWSEGLMSTEESSFDELYSFLDSLTPVNDFLPITDYSHLSN